MTGRDRDFWHANLATRWQELQAPERPRSGGSGACPTHLPRTQTP